MHRGTWYTSTESHVDETLPIAPPTCVVLNLALSGVRAVARADEASRKNDFLRKTKARQNFGVNFLMYEKIITKGLNVCLFMENAFRLGRLWAFHASLRQ